MSQLFQIYSLSLSRLLHSLLTGTFTASIAFPIIHNNFPFKPIPSLVFILLKTYEVHLLVNLPFPLVPSTFGSFPSCMPKPNYFRICFSTCSNKFLFFSISFSLLIPYLIHDICPVWYWWGHHSSFNNDGQICFSTSNLNLTKCFQVSQVLPLITLLSWNYLMLNRNGDITYLVN